jgi:AbrB family looped-hinge helix DNA binding protein
VRQADLAEGFGLSMHAGLNAWLHERLAASPTLSPRCAPSRWTFLTQCLTVYHMKATVTSKGQITIPLPIRRKLRLHKGTVLEFDEAADHLKAITRVDAERMRAVIGIARKELAGKSVAEWIEELRGPLQLPRKRRG